MTAPTIPESSPFSAEQRYWLNGFLAGLAQAGAAGSPGIPAPNRESVPVLVLYGSQSGTAEGLAHAVAEKLTAKAQAGSGPALAPRVLGMEHFREVAWATETRILLLSSTWGEGDMPDNAVSFWEFLKSIDAPVLSHASYAVLGLGDRNYARFCQAGKNLDGRFAELGAKRLRPLCECDTDYETKAEQWMVDAIDSLEAELGSRPEKGSAKPAATGQAQPTKAAPKPAAAYDRKRPFPAPLLENHPLNAKGSAKDTRHLSFSLLGSGLSYKVGDALGVYPRNCYELVDRIILSLNCLGSERIALEGGEEAPLRTALLSRFDLRRPTPRLLESIRQAARNTGEKRRLYDLFAEDGVKAQEYLSVRDVLDVLQDFPYTQISACWVLS